MVFLQNFNKLMSIFDYKYIIITVYSTIILFSSLIFNPVSEILEGVVLICKSPGILITDYIEVGNIGAAFFNSGILMIACIAISVVTRSKMNGTMIAAIFTVGGFAFFGKNIINIWPIIIGVFIHAKVQKESFGKYILVAFFGTALAPLVSQIIFGIGLEILYGVILGVFAGLIAGFILPPLANSFVKFHQGFNIYNIGFTAGVIGTLFMSLFRGFGGNPDPEFIISSGNNTFFTIYFAILFLSMIIAGLFINNGLSGYLKLLKRSGRLVSDFVTLDGFGLSLFNMGALGLFSLGYVVLIGGEINGPSIGGILTIVGFASFGKHLKNVWPILAGVFIASMLKIWDTNQPGAVLAALFGTTLAPIAGEFGWKAGIVAGFVHMSMVMNVGYLHGGINLYNNGFAGGIVAAIFVPLLFSMRRGDIKDVTQ